MKHVLVAAGVAVAASCLGLAGCATLRSALSDEPLVQPHVALEDVTLVSLPSRQSLSAYMCPRVLVERVGLGAGAGLMCSGFFGPVPPDEQMAVSFDVQLHVENPNRVPLPLGSVLTALTLFPGKEESKLGTACVQLCDVGEKECRPRDDDACSQEATDLTRGEDVAALLISQGARLASGEPLGGEPPKVRAEEALDVVVRFSVAPDELLPVMEELARRSADDFENGRAVSLSIPYSIEGKLFADAGSLGAVAAPFGPTRGTWTPTADTTEP